MNTDNNSNSKYPIRFLLPSTVDDIDRTGLIQHPTGWIIQDATDTSPIEEGYSGPGGPEGVFLKAEEILPIQAHILGPDGWTYHLHSPQPYQVRFLTSAPLEPGEYRVSMTFHADWRYDFWDETIPPDKPEHSQIRFIVGTKTSDWIVPRHLQTNQLAHHFEVTDGTPVMVGFEVWSHNPATSNGLFLQSFQLEFLDGLEAMEQHRIVVNLLPQDASLQEKWHVLFNTHEVRQAILQSHDDAINLVRQGRSDSFIRLWGRDRMNPDQLSAIQQAGLGVQDEQLTGIKLQALPESTLEGISVVVVNLLPQDATLLEKWFVLQSVHEARQSILQSHDDALLLTQMGGANSFIRLWARNRFHADQLKALQTSGFRLVDESFRIPKVTPQPSGGFRLTHWPCEGNKITQSFGANPERYEKFGFPGHEGVDIFASFGSPVFAMADGKVVAIENKETGYGIFIRINHEGGYQSIYGHLKGENVQVDQFVKGGDTIGFADSTGNVFPKPTPENPHAGSHLHISLRLKDHVSEYPHGYIDPTPFLKQLPQFPGDSIPPPPPPKPSQGKTFDLLDYLRGDSRLFEVRSDNGAQERFQTQVEGHRFFIVKNANWEELWADNDYVWRGFDTSPDDKRYYIQQEAGKEGARWANRRMRIGERFTGFGHHVQFYFKENCHKTEVNSGRATNITTLLAHHASKTWNGITVNDVIELKGIGEESYFFARGFGLVGWSAPWGSSGINEIHAPGARPDNERLKIPCIKRE
jgi:murein DD-endopeptidase MepM/ murein hydrolase activator NlpD